MANCTVHRHVYNMWSIKLIPPHALSPHHFHNYSKSRCFCRQVSFKSHDQHEGWMARGWDHRSALYYLSSMQVQSLLCRLKPFIICCIGIWEQLKLVKQTVWATTCQKSAPVVENRSVLCINGLQIAMKLLILLFFSLANWDHFFGRLKLSVKDSWCLSKLFLPVKKGTRRSTAVSPTQMVEIESL